jgi:membrane-associated phospholipid phosphatase
MKISVVGVITKIRVMLVPYLVILAFCLVISVVYNRDQIYFTINSWHFPLGDTFFALWTNMGDGITCVIISLLLLILNYRWGFLMATSYALTSLIAQTLKLIFQAPRPVIYFKDQASRMYLIKGVEMLETHSFPSGHSVSGFAMAVVLTYIIPKKNWGIFFLIMALLIAYSRVYLSEHFFEDVTAGSAIGVFVTVFWIKWIDSKPFIHSKKWDRGLLIKSKN